jgi:hypothetical protein
MVRCKKLYAGDPEDPTHFGNTTSNEDGRDRAEGRRRKGNLQEITELRFFGLFCHPLVVTMAMYVAQWYVYASLAVKEKTHIMQCVIVTWA